MPDTATRAERDTHNVVGRASEVDSVVRSLRSGVQWLSLTGPPGIGKSKLVAAAVSRADMDFRLISCAACETMQDIEATIIAALPGPQLPDESDIDAALADAGALTLVLDDIDTVLDALAPHIERWLGAHPELTVVTTARRAAHSPLEDEFIVGPLSTDAAAELFEARASRILQASWSDEDRQAMRTIAEKLDAVPLAIELAASRCRVLPPRLLVKRLDDELRALEAANGGSALETVIARSVSGLDEEELRLLLHLSVPAGGFDLLATEQSLPEVLSGIDTSARLERLCDHHLVHWSYAPIGDAGMRYRLLRPIRAFGLRRLRESGGEADATERWMNAIVARGESLSRNRGEDTGLGWAVEEIDNLLWIISESDESDMVEKAASLLLPIFRERGANRTHLSLIDRTIGGAATGTIRTTGFLAEAAVSSREPDTAIIDRLRDAADSGDEHLRYDASRSLARVLQKRGNLPQAIDYAQRAVDLAVASAPGRVAHAHAYLGNLLIRVGRDEEAEAAYTRTLVLVRNGRDAHLLANTLVNYGRLLASANRTDAAAAHFEEALAVSREGELDRSAIAAASALARIEADRGDVDKAIRLLTESRQLARARADERAWASATLELTLLELGRRDGVRARQLLQEIGGASISTRQHARLRWAEAGAALANGQASTAAELGQRALVTARQSRRWKDAICSGVLLAIAQHRNQKPTLARARLAEVNDYRDVAPWAAELISVAENVLAGGTDAQRKTELSILPRAVLGAVAGSLTAPGSSQEIEPLEPSGPVLRVGPDLSYVVIDDNEPVSLRRRALMRRLIRALVDARSERPGEALDTPAMIEAGWPGERMLYDSARNRLYVAISTLRKLGLASLLKTRDDGYLLDPRVRVIEES